LTDPHGRCPPAGQSCGLACGVLSKKKCCHNQSPPSIKVLSDCIPIHLLITTLLSRLSFYHTAGRSTRERRWREKMGLKMGARTNASKCTCGPQAPSRQAPSTRFRTLSIRFAAAHVRASGAKRRAPSVGRQAPSAKHPFPNSLHSVCCRARAGLGRLASQRVACFKRFR
jgi:hypothetical protein